MKMTKTRDVKTPTRATAGSAGIDFFIPKDFYLMLQPNESILIPSGIKVELQPNQVFIAHNKSSIAKLGLIVGASVIDSDYTGEIHINLWNVSKQAIAIVEDMKIVQFILSTYISDDIELVSEDKIHNVVTERGNGGFGSTENKKYIKDWRIWDEKI